MANILFNELSLDVAAKGLENVVKLLVEDLKFLNKLQIGRPIFYAGEYSRLVKLFYDENKQFLNLVNLLDRDSKALIKYFLGSTRNLDSTAHTHTEQSTNSIVDYVNSFLELPSKAGSISFRSKTDWNVWKLNFTYNFPPHDVFPIAHIANLAHDLLVSSNQLEGFISSLPDDIIDNIKGTDCLPKSFISSFYLFQIREAYKKSQELDRKGSHGIVGSSIARLNGYVSRPDIEKINKNGEKIRHIFYSQTTGKYLSIDIMHGAFEVCSGNGTHLKEINFNGEDLSGPDASHSIQVH